MPVRPLAHHRSNAVKEKVPEWEPHYRGRFAKDTLDKLVDNRFQWVDSRKIRELMLSNELVVELWDNPMNDGKGVIITPVAFRVMAEPNENDPAIETLGNYRVWPAGRGFKVWSVNIPTGMGNLAYTFRSVRGQDSKFRVTNF
jgi:hypothetical protein